MRPSFHSQTKALIRAAGVACLIFTAPVQATELVGRVVDNADALVFSGATVNLRKSLDQKFEAQSDTEGFFRMTNLPAGAYLIDVTLSDGRTFLTRLMINPKRTKQFIELDYSRVVTPDHDDHY
jgi:hypothetical protein